MLIIHQVFIIYLETLNDSLPLPSEFSYLYLTGHPKLVLNAVTSRLPVYIIYFRVLD